MAPRKFQFALAEILDEIGWIERLSEDKLLADFQADRTLRYAIERSIEIISEASRRIPEEWKLAQTHIDWRAIAGMGNVMRHEYHTTSAEIVWNVVQEELQPLKEAVQAIASATPQEKDEAPPET